MISKLSQSAYRSLVHVNLLVSEVRHLFERVDGDEYRTDVSKDPILQESLLKVLMDVRLRDLSKFAILKNIREFVIMPSGCY